jgi:hypothetical protein
MTIKNTSLLFIVFISLFSCKNLDPNNQIDEGNIKNSVYKSREIGWQMEIPKGWELISMEETDKLQKKGEDLLQPMLEEEIDVSQLRNLLSFKKNVFNMFQSTSEPFEIEYEGEWEENNIALKELLQDTLAQQGITATSSDITTEIIDGLEFKVYKFIIYSPDNKVILNQIMYTRWIDGFDFGVNINYNDEALRDEMLTAFRNSKFTKQKQ